MADEYVKVGTTLRTSFDYPDPVTAGSWVTGLTQADFTIHLIKNGTDGQSTTGITITEDVTTAGKYIVAVSGTTGFMATTATWDLVIYRTSDVGQRWTNTIRVTSDGTGAGSWGAAAFTPAASDGRVLASATPLPDVTIRVVDPNNVLYVQTVSDASGLWPTVYFSASGTYTVNYLKSGYSIGTASIVVSGSTATGPLADITLTATATSTGLTASSLWAYAKRVMKDRSGLAADLMAQQIVDDALTMISQECEWPWYETYGVIDLAASYNTGTLTVTNASAVVTLAAGTFPTWAASGEIYMGGQFYRVLSRDSGTQVTLVAAYPGATASGVAYVIGRTSYTLPTDLQSIDEVTFDVSWPMPPVAVSMGTLLQMRGAAVHGQSRPAIYAIAKDQFVVWPIPTIAYRVNVQYFRRPAFLVSASDQADWDPLHLALLRRAIECQCATRGDCVTGPPDECFKLYRAQLLKAQEMDKTAADRSMSQIGAWDYDVNLRGTISG